MGPMFELELLGSRACALNDHTVALVAPAGLSLPPIRLLSAPASFLSC